MSSWFARSGDILANRVDDCVAKHNSVSLVAAEVIFFLFKVGESLLDPVTRLYIYRGVCLQEFANGTYVCDNLEDFPAQENVVQTISANYLLYYKLILNVPAMFLGLFCGAWSDKIGRKIPAMLSAFGTIVAVLFYMMSMLSTDGDTGKPMLFLVFVGACIRGGFGKSAVMTMALHSYVSDISSKETRTARLGRLVSMNFFGCFAGSLLVGALLEIAGFDAMFCCVVIVNSICVVLIITLMYESVPPIRSHSDLTGEGGGFATGLPPPPLLAVTGPDTRSSDKINLIEEEEEDEEEEAEPVQRKMKIPFRFKHIRESVDVLIKPRKNHVRLHILFLFFVITFHQLCKSGEVDITLLFVQKSPLSWSKSMYGYLLAVDYACLSIASAFIIPLLIHCIDISDVVLVSVGIAFKILRLVILTFSDLPGGTWMVFLSVILGCPSALIVSGVKSLLSKLVGEEEIGKTFSLLSCGETLSNLIGSLVFTSMYTATVGWFPGFTFSVDAMASFVMLLALIGIAWDMVDSGTYAEVMPDDDSPKRSRHVSLLQNITEDAEIFTAATMASYGVAPSPTGGREVSGDGRRSRPVSRHPSRRQLSESEIFTATSIANYGATSSISPGSPKATGSLEGVSTGVAGSPTSVCSSSAASERMLGSPPGFGSLEGSSGEAILKQQSAGSVSELSSPSSDIINAKELSSTGVVDLAIGISTAAGKDELSAAGHGAAAAGTRERAAAAPFSTAAAGGRGIVRRRTVTGVESESETEADDDDEEDVLKCVRSK